MSQALATMIGGDKVDAYSAGSKPSGTINPKAIAAMKELGYDLGTHKSKSLEEVKQIPADKKLNYRTEKFGRMGFWDEVEEETENIEA